MAQLDSTDRARIWRGLMRYWSNLREVCGVSKADLLAAVVAIDVWLDDNAGAINAAFPVVTRTGLTASQKSLLFCCVMLMRFSPGVASLLRRALGVEVN